MGRAAALDSKDVWLVVRSVYFWTTASVAAAADFESLAHSVSSEPCRPPRPSGSRSFERPPFNLLLEIFHEFDAAFLADNPARDFASTGTGLVRRITGRSLVPATHPPRQGGQQHQRASRCLPAPSREGTRGGGDRGWAYGNLAVPLGPLWPHRWRIGRVGRGLAMGLRISLAFEMRAVCRGCFDKLRR
jgi:hypothetical protein